MIVWGTGCPNCAVRVRNSLLALDDLYSVDLHFNLAVAEISYDSQKIMLTEFATTVAKAGNDVRHEYRAQLVSME